MEHGFSFDHFCIEQCLSFIISLIDLLGLYFIFSEHHSGCCLNSVGELPSPRITHLEAFKDRQSLLVNWLVNKSSLVGDIYEIQIGRTENYAVIYNKNLSIFSVDPVEYAWTWTSDLPLECVDHSVRIRCFYNQSVPSAWSNWKTNNRTQVKGETRIFPVDRVMRENSSAMFCCVPPRGVNIISMTFNQNEYPLISIGAGVKAITVHNLTIPKLRIKRLVLSCDNTAGGVSEVWNFISFPPQKPRNISCQTSDMIIVECSWDSGRKRDKHDHNKQTQTLHIDNSDQLPINCKASTCTFPTIPHLKEYYIRLVVKDQLGEETESYSFNISDRVLPVVEVEGVSLGVTYTTVSWIVHGNLTQLNLLCQVTADPGSATKLRYNSVSGLCKVKLEHLLPNTWYSTRVRCSVDGRLWGKWTKPRSFKTYPFVTLDVWRRITQLSDPNSRQVTLLWTPHVTDSAAEIQGYRVQWSQGGQNWSETKDSEQTQAEVAINLGQYDFTVQALLHTGSAIPAHIIIPQRDNDESVQSPILVEPVQSTSSSVTLEWSYNEDDPAHTAFITGYLVTGQEAGTDALPAHVENLFNVSVADARRKSVTIEGLRQDHKYVFSLSALTKEGPGQSTNITIRTKTNYSAQVAKILTPILLLLGCIIALWPQRKILKSRLREIFAYPAGMTIKTPELDSFLHETGERMHALKVEEYRSCDIEILNSRPLLKETTALRDPAPPNTLPSLASQSSAPTTSLSSVLLETGYCPQSATVLRDRPDIQQMTSIKNEPFHHTMEEDSSEAQQLMFSEIKSSFEPSGSVHDSCSVIYGYISNNTL
ncbi:leukemia inhibitory factor receptor isoform X2 [Eleginops maclovinus]|uniref:leukemia inhibitory factor receptor isoform X2 n=1 Tax=Eleginops maclovinus TaxID=56733 RepID=UPI003080C9A0